MRRKLVIGVSVLGAGMIIGLWLLQKHPHDLPLGAPGPSSSESSGPQATSPPVNGNKISPDSNASADNPESSEDAGTDEKTPLRKIRIYFSEQQGQSSHSHSVPRPVPSSAQVVKPSVIRATPSLANDKAGSGVSADENPLLGYAVMQLLKGPSDEESAQGLYSEIPKGTRMLGFNVTPQKVTINLSRQFASGGGSNSMVQRLEELTKTVKETLPKSPTPHAEVYLQLEGKPLTILGGEGISVPEPIVSGKKHHAHQWHRQSNALPAILESKPPAYEAKSLSQP